MTPEPAHIYHVTELMLRDRNSLLTSLIRLGAAGSGTFSLVPRNFILASRSSPEMWREL